MFFRKTSFSRLFLAVIILFTLFIIKAEVLDKAAYAATLVGFSSNSEVITLEIILNKHIPKPFNAIVYSDNIEFKGKMKKEVMPVLIKEMKKSGWAEITDARQDSMQYFIKEIDGRSVKISIIPAERGGPEEENTSTFIYFRLISRNMKR